ncbi:MAG: LysR family transcriptional regulator [Chloroflexota bacterium]
MISLYKLEIFDLVVQTGSFSKAAKRLYLTQAAISQHIAQLETSLGIRLFERGPRGVTLTAKGETLHDYTQRILALVAEAENAVTHVENLATGQINIGATPGINVYLLPKWVQTFQARYHNLSLTMTSDITPGLINALISGKLDIAIVEGEMDDDSYPSVSRMNLEDIALSVIIGKGHRCWYRDAAPADALDGQPFVLRQSGSQTRTWIQGILAKHNIKPRVVAEFDNPEAIKHAVASGMGITILPEYVVKREVEMGLLRAIPLENVPLIRTIKILWDQTIPFTPITRAFLDVLAMDYPHLSSLVQGRPLKSADKMDP